VWIMWGQPPSAVQAATPSVAAASASARNLATTNSSSGTDLTRCRSHRTLLVGIRINIAGRRIAIHPPRAVPIRWPIPKRIPPQAPSKTPAAAPAPAPPIAIAAIAPAVITASAIAAACETTISTERIVRPGSRIRGQPRSNRTMGSSEGVPLSIRNCGVKAGRACTISASAAT
jgi:hypothetical protein